VDEKRGVLTGIVEGFLRGNLPILVILISLIAGAIALTVTPREEEPQIVVPLADILVSYPGGSAEEVEKMVASRLERLLYQIDGVEYVYSMSRPGMAVVTVRFFVGEDREDSLIKLYNKLQQNIDKVTPGITGWIVKPIEIDDVPIVSAALYSSRYGTHELYRVAEEVVSKLQHVPNSARITIHGGEPRVAKVELNRERLAAYGISVMEILGALRMSNSRIQAGAFQQANREVLVEAGPFLRNPLEMRNLLIGLHRGRPVYLRDVATIADGPDEVSTHTRLGFGPAAKDVPGNLEAAQPHASVTIAVAKKKGSNAVWVAREIEAALDRLKGRVIPDEVHTRITRNYGETANDKVNDLVQSLGLAIITVIGLLTLTLNWRAGIIVALAIPITYSLTLLANYLLGYTINRVTLFALILALGLLVDDPIAGVENIQRHLRMARLPRLQAVVFAMSEIMPPIVLSTLAIIIAFTPMFFITGMMGPYMRPMALNVPITVLMSTVVALTVTPWLSSKLLRGKSTSAKDDGEAAEKSAYGLYARVMGPFVDSKRTAVLLLGVMGILFVFSTVMALTGLVPLKMLPFDNKNEFQILVDMPESTTLEKTDAVVRGLERYVQTLPEVTDFSSTVGTGSPMDFNGLVRHYYLRSGPNVADLRVNLVHRNGRKADSHSLVLRIRNDIAAIGRKHGANLKLVEVPPGPPVLATAVAEIYGEPHHRYEELIAAARTVRERMAEQAGIVDLDDSVEAGQQTFVFETDRDKAGRNGIAVEDITRVLRLALSGMPAGILHTPGEQNELPIVLRLPREARSSIAKLQTIPVKGRAGHVVQLGELGAFREAAADKTIFHKNQERVVYVMSEVAGIGPAYPILSLQSHFRKNPLPPGIRLDWRGEGEWKITLDVFRDLGIAFSIALLGIYVLLVYETSSYLLPVIIMMSIPLTMIGIMPGFWLLNVFVNRPVGGFDNPVFFTATAMIGMIALSGIVVRNAIVLIDFIRKAIARGEPLREAILQSGAVRFRPIVLTAATTMLGAWPITLDPIFSGLAWSLIFGLFVSTVFTLIVIPTVYYLVYRKGEDSQKSAKNAKSPETAVS